MAHFMQVGLGKYTRILFDRGPGFLNLGLCGSDVISRERIILAGNRRREVKPDLHFKKVPGFKSRDSEFG